MEPVYFQAFARWSLFEGIRQMEFVYRHSPDGVWSFHGICLMEFDRYHAFARWSLLTSIRQMEFDRF